MKKLDIILFLTTSLIVNAQYTPDINTNQFVHSWVFTAAVKRIFQIEGYLYQDDEFILRKKYTE